MSTRNERLEQFFGGYFHQDWDIEGAQSWRDVVKQYSVDAPRAQMLAIRTDLQDWLDESVNDENENLPPSFACDYDARSEGLTEREWVRQIVAELARLTNT